MMRAGEAVNELKREAEELDRANERDDAEMEFTRKIESSIKNMRLDGKLTDFGRLRKVGGDIEVWPHQTLMARGQDRLKTGVFCLIFFDVKCTFFCGILKNHAFVRFNRL